ncbi:MAG TPA: hypothetical protein VLC09_01280 [Polyangiaceae bacterium]|nr:hypothetical protein [Polyangiaceae bacterium]
MLDRLSLWFRYEFERFLMRGPLSRLLLVAWLIGLISVVGGVLGHVYSDQFSGFPEAIWWAFLRLTDPGYLGDDRGVFLRTLSTVITVGGYVIFLGALVAIMTQWFTSTMGALASGVTPIVRRNHIVIIGWTNRTAAIVNELFSSSGRVKRFLRLRGTSELHVAILSERKPQEILDELELGLGSHFRKSALTVRHGSPIRVEHLERVDFLRASAILVPSDDERGSGWTTRDEDAVKVLMALGQAMREAAPENPPVLVAEVSSDEKAAVGRRAYRGDSEVVPTEQMVAWMLAQDVKCPGTLAIFDELLAQPDGHRLYVSPAQRLVGRSVEELAHLIPQAVVLGILRDGLPIANPRPDEVVVEGDRLITLASDLRDTTRFELDAQVMIPTDVVEREIEIVDEPRRVLLLGWSRKVPALIDALGSGELEAAQIDIFALTPIVERERLIHRMCPHRRAALVRHFEGDMTSRRDLGHLEFGEYDHVILVASDRFETDAESDARTILGWLTLEELLERSHDFRRPRISVEILRSENAELLQRRELTVVQSAAIPSLLLTQVCLYRELHAVFDDIVRPGGAEIRIVKATLLGLARGSYRFVELQNRAQRAGLTLLGVRGNNTTSPLAPGRDARIELGRDSELIVLLVDQRTSKLDSSAPPSIAYQLPTASRAAQPEI